MKRSLLVLLAALCAAPRLTHLRKWGTCHAADPNVIECGGNKVAQVECFGAGDEVCGALAVHYSDGERVFLYRPPGFEPDQTQYDFGTPGVIRPEMGSDGRLIWYKTAGSRSGSWQTFDPQTGEVREVDAFRIFQIRERDRSSMPLWVKHIVPQ